LLVGDISDVIGRYRLTRLQFEIGEHIIDKFR
jgi:hypothetical protein